MHLVVRSASTSLCTAYNILLSAPFPLSPTGVPSPVNKLSAYFGFQMYRQKSRKEVLA